MPEIIRKNIHVRFSTEQRAALADQMADVQSSIDGVEDAKKKEMAGFNAKLKVLRSRMHEYATAVRDGEGDIVVECMWKPDPGKPFEHLWRLDTYEQIETRPLAGSAKPAGKGATPAKAADAERQTSLLATTPAGPGDGKAPAAGAAPGEQPPRPGATVTRLRIGPMPPCPAPVKEAPGGICGADGDRDYCEGFCQKHHAELPVEQRRGILEGIADMRRQMRVQEASERRARQQADAIASEDDVKRAELHTKADKAKGPELDAIGNPLACARAIEEGKGGEGETVRAPETDEDYRARVKVAIDAAHKAATARAVARGELDALCTAALGGDAAALVKLWDKGVRHLAKREGAGDVALPILRSDDGKLSIGAAVEAVPPIVREKPREVTPDLIAQLAQKVAELPMVAREQALRSVGLEETPAAAAGGEQRWDSIGPDNGPLTPEKMAEGAALLAEESARLDAGHLAALGVTAAAGAALLDLEGDDVGNVAPPPAPPDEVIDDVAQPLYNARRADGWPLCPQCGADELWSPAIPQTEATIVHCEACGWRPPVDALPIKPVLVVAPDEKPRVPFVPGHQVIHIGDVEIDTSGILDHGRLLKMGPCAHTDSSEACVKCTEAAVASERERLASAAGGETPAVKAEEEVCAKLRRAVTPLERNDRKAACSTCGKLLNIRPVQEDGEWVATLAQHKRLEAQS